MKINKRKLSLLAPLALMLTAVVGAVVVSSYQVTSTATITSSPNLFLVQLSNGLGYTTQSYGNIAPPSAVDGFGCFRNNGNTILFVGGSQSYSIASGSIPTGSTLTIVADGDGTFTAIPALQVAVGQTLCGAASGYHLRLNVPMGTSPGSFTWVVAVNAFDVSTP